MSFIVRDYNPKDREDAERVARMFNDFDSAWPGGFTRGVLETAESIRERVARMHRLAMLVADCDGELVGYCDLEAQPGQTEICYVDLLGARASHHGQGVGKMLLREIIRRSTALGYQQVTLHTWAGNTKAVPLYKKTGFHWVPESNVFMRNFIPTILNMPVGREFFAHRDWYACHEREIVVAPDDVTWKGMKVYPYRFRDGDDFLHLTFSVEGERLTAIETPTYAVSCVIPVAEAPAGETVPIVWEIAPAEGRTLEVALLTEAEPGLELSVQERLTISSQTTIRRELRISPCATPRRPGEPAHRVRSTLLIDGQPVVLETGVKVVRPVEIHYWGEGLFPGRSERILVPLHSNLDRPIQGQLAFDAHPSISVEPPVQRFTLEPRLATQCEFTVTVLEPGVFPVALRYTADEMQDSRPVHFRAFGHSGPLASIDPIYDESAVLESPELKVAINMRGGAFWLYNPQRGRGMIDQGLAELGPPFVQHRMRESLHDVRFEQTALGPQLTLTAPSQERAGLTVQRSLSLVGGDLVRVDYRVINTTDRPQPAQLRLNTWCHLDDWLTAPTRGGLVREPLRGHGDYPQGEMDVLASQAPLAENWICCEQDGLYAGMLWHTDGMADMSWSRMPNLTWDLGEVPAHSVTELKPFYIAAGAGDWRSTRGWWRRLIQPSGAHEEAPPTPQRVLEVRCEPSPAILNATEHEVQIEVISRRGKPLTGTLLLKGDLFSAEPSSFAISDVDRDHPFSAPIRLAAPNVPAAGFLHATVDSGPVAEQLHVPLIRLGQGGEVRVTAGEQDTIVVENGLLTLRVAPGFFGSLYSVERDGVNHLLSAFPHPKPFVWMNPWFGGIHPFVGWTGNPKLAHETFQGGPVERLGERQLRWAGARVTCDLQHKDLRWLRLEVEYLTTPGSNVVALVSRWTNRATARLDSPGNCGMALWAQVGGTRDHTVVHWDRHGEARQRRRGGFPADGRSNNRVTLENSQTGDLLALVNSEPRGYTGFEDLGEEGMHLHVATPIEFVPGETREIVTWLVLTRQREQLDAYGVALSTLRRLP